MKKLSFGILKYIILGIFVCWYSQLHAQTPITQFKTIQTLVDSNRFQMVFSIATTHHTYYLQPNTPYVDQNIRIDQDSAFVVIQDSIATGYLPYYKSGYQTSQNEKKSIIFFNKMLNLKKQTHGKGRRQAIIYQFDVIGTNDTYKITIDIRYNGQCYMFVNSLKKSPINYTGQIVERTPSM